MEIILSITIVLIVQIWLYYDWKKRKKLKGTKAINLRQIIKPEIQPLKVDWMMSNFEIARFDNEYELSNHVRKKLLVQLVDHLYANNDFFESNNFITYKKFESCDIPLLTNYQMEIKIVQQKPIKP